MIETVEDAEKWVRKQGCSDFRADLFTEASRQAIEHDRSSFNTEDGVKDYVDGLRRAPYVGLGI